MDAETDKVAPSVRYHEDRLALAEWRRDHASGLRAALQDDVAAEHRRWLAEHCRRCGSPSSAGHGPECARSA
jgi:hypothetical protein